MKTFFLFFCALALSVSADVDSIGTPSPSPSPSPLPYFHSSDVFLSHLSDESGEEFDGAAMYDSFGFAVSGLGDVNNDGYEDFIVGAPNAVVNARSLNETIDERETIEQEVPVSFFYHAETSESSEDDSTVGTGECYLVLGNKGFRKPSKVIFLGVEAGEEAGFSVAKGGDINNDGIGDFLIGAPKASHGDLKNAGKVYVVFGSLSYSSPFHLSDLNGENGFVIYGAHEDGEFGHSVSGAGDINGDGYDDIIVGAPHGLDSAGVCYVIFGGKSFRRQFYLSHLNGGNGFIVRGQHEGGLFGSSVSVTDSLNGDGLADIVIGARRENDYAGRIYVIFGQNSFLRYWRNRWFDGRRGFIINGVHKDDLLGGSVGSLGDVNGDGYNDFVIGAHHATPLLNRPQSGAAYVIFGSLNLPKYFDLNSLDGNNGFQINGESSFDFLGKDVKGAGDVNYDGYNDIILGANGASGATGRKSGKTYVVFGKKGTFTNPFALSTLDGTNGFQIEGAHAYDGSGFAVSGAGDVDGDGYGDVLVGTWRASYKKRVHNGKVFVVFG